mmetsp:Transcript_28893/g.25559  ORF Transcript_28893/g.25559 Transcript_28893/m.25559 type:complete len:87 (-) Transcript_28893:15-275(-)
MRRRIRKGINGKKDQVPLPLSRRKRWEIAKPSLWKFKNKNKKLSLEELVRKDSYELLLEEIITDLKSPSDPFKTQNENFEKYYKNP